MSFEKAECLVYAFVAIIKSSLPGTTTIPECIRQLCLKFYFIAEEFTVHGPNIKINQSKDIAWRHDQSECILPKNTVYGNIVIDPSNKNINMYKWTFRILELRVKDGFYVGIDSSNKYYTHSHFTLGIYQSRRAYAFTMCGRTRPKKASKYYRELIFNEGDVICLILNIKTRVLGIIIDDEVIETCHHNVQMDHVEYHLAIAMHYNGQKIQLINYETEHY